VAPRPDARSPTALALAALAVVALCRLWLAFDLPLTDTTEARYGEMARKMVETGTWLLAQHDYGVPFLAKPPLAFWASAVGIAAGGANELAPRLPILLAAAAFCALYWRSIRAWCGAGAAAVATLALATSLLYFVAAAAVMTDLLLTASIGVAVLMFWERWRGGSRRAEAALYVALGAGLLIKGPLAVVLTLAPIAAWAVLFGRVREVWQRFAWWRGALLAALIAVPWYVAAELRYPGFLDYFIVGEHIQRFLVPGWNGDLYGRAHEVPRGTIWLFLALAALPWTLVAPAWLWVRRADVRARWRAQRELAALALLAALAPLALFTFAGNVIWPYALPPLPFIALAAVVLAPPGAAAVRRAAVVGAAGCVLVTGFTSALIADDDGFIAAHSQRGAIRALLARDANRAIYYWQDRYFSAEYYSGGKARVADAAALERALAARTPFWLVVERKLEPSIPAPDFAQLHEIGARGDFALLEPRYAAAANGGS
jgi:4-amino-4-deoxy-L-arabinose transferase-like glycosyltransferase